MNKYFKLFAGLAVAMTFASCSDEPNVGPENEENKPIGDIAYMAVRIQSASDSRSRGTDGGFEDSNDDSHATTFANEHDVKSAKFFFFDANGVYVTTGTLTTYPTLTGETTETPANNIEFKAPGVIVLDKLKNKGYPKYMLTVLNPADDFAAEITLAATSKKLHDFYKSKSTTTGEGEDATTTSTNYFTMSTTSYYGDNETAHHQDKAGNLDTYYVTTLKDTDFKDTPDAAKDTEPVDVYVERLAAKVEVSWANAYSEADGDITVDGTKLYKLTSTLGGSDNTDENGNNTATTDLYVKVVGWTLNATSNKSYISKQLGSSNNPTYADWATEASQPFVNWQDATRYRSYWAMGTSYGHAPTDAEITYKTTNKLNAHTDANNTHEYCNENTNLTDYIFDENGNIDCRYVTHVAIQTVVCDKNGNGIDLIGYQGIYYTTDSFKQYILAVLNAQGKLNFYYEDGKETVDGVEKTKYTQVGVEYLDIIKDGNETGKVKLVVATSKADVALYKEVIDADKNVTHSLITDGITELGNEFATITGLTKATGGNTVYYLPIEHLAPAGANNNKQVEGYYGVVRNHWYQITISDFKHLGHGIFDPNSSTEILKPEKPEDPLYYVGAKINILNWHIVKQGSEL